MSTPNTLTDALVTATGPLDQLDAAEAAELADRLRAIADALPGTDPAEHRQADALRIAADCLAGN